MKLEKKADRPESSSSKKMSKKKTPLPPVKTEPVMPKKKQEYICLHYCPRCCIEVETVGKFHTALHCAACGVAGRADTEMKRTFKRIEGGK